MSNKPLVPELVLPAGNLIKLRMALAYGADAVYAGAAGFSMRPDGSSFSVETLGQGVEEAHAARKRFYVGVNCLMGQEDLEPLRGWLKATAEIPFDAVIVSDPGAFGLVKERRPELPIHISTQLSTANAGAARFWGEAGARRVVLARECSLADAKVISGTAGIETEVFVHGAMCMAISGRCLLSAHLCGYSGSKGDCKHACRWEWRLIEQKRPGQSFPIIETERGTILLGSTDLCLIEHIPELVLSGVRALKVEGRMKSTHYVATVARVYRAALDAYARDPAKYRPNPAWLEELERVSHRPFETGFAFGYPTDRARVLQTHIQKESTRELVAYVENESGGLHRIAVKNALVQGDTLEWIAPSGAGGEVTVAAILGPEGQPAERGHCGTAVQVRFSDELRLEPLAILRRQVDRDG